MPKQAEHVSLAAYAAAVVNDTFHNRNSLEREKIQDLEKRYGAPASGNLWPTDGLRDLTAGSPTGGSTLTSTQYVGYLQTFLNASRVQTLGATPTPMGKGTSTLGRGVTAASTTWSTTESTGTTESQPTFGQVSFMRHDVSVSVEFSRQFLLQTDANNYLTAEIRRLLGVACDAAWIAGTGINGQPTGIINAAGIGAITGTSLSYSALMDGAQTVSDNNGVVSPDKLGYLTTPAVARLLKGRFINTNSTPVWKGQIAGGEIEGAPAYSSKNVPAATLLFADWSQVLLAEWADGLVISVDPFTKMSSGIVGLRAIVSTDVALANANSLAVASSVT